MQKPLRVLMIEDSAEDALLVLRALRRGGYDVVSARVDTAAGMRAALAEGAWDVVISDYSMPQFSGPAALQVLKDQGPDVPFIIVSGAIGEDVAVEAMRCGAHDYLMKDKLARLVPAVERELREAGVRRQRRETEERLQRAERLASLGTFAAGLAHEINNPLAAILLNARHGLKVVDGSPELGAVLREIVEDTERCARIVTHVLQFARQQPSAREPVPLAGVLRVARDQAQKHAGQGGRRVELQLPDEWVTVDGNATELEQVFVNVIQNALQASPPGAAVVVRGDRAGDRVRIRVEDYGAGMTEETRARVFDPFFTTRAREGGTGLGLSMAHGIVTEHGGTVRLDTRLGHGTTVTVELPCAAAGAAGER